MTFATRGYFQYERQKHEKYSKQTRAELIRAFPPRYKILWKSNGAEKTLSFFFIICWQRNLQKMFLEKVEKDN